MAEDLLLSLQAFPPEDQDKQSLQYLISRINEQKGSFRNVTEQSLEEDIQAVKDGADEEQDVVAAVEEVEDGKEVSTAREEMLKQVA